MPVGRKQKRSPLFYIVMLDGRIIGHVEEPLARDLTNTLRYYKIIEKVRKSRFRTTVVNLLPKK